MRSSLLQIVGELAILWPDILLKICAIAEGGQLVQARLVVWAPLIFQDLFKKEQ